MTPLPEGWIVATASHYKGTYAIQILNTKLGAIIRGTGDTFDEAYEEAVRKIADGE